MYYPEPLTEKEKEELRKRLGTKGVIEYDVTQHLGLYIVNPEALRRIYDSK